VCLSINWEVQKTEQIIISRGAHLLYFTGCPPGTYQSDKGSTFCQGETSLMLSNF